MALFTAIKSFTVKKLYSFMTTSYIHILINQIIIVVITFYFHICIGECEDVETSHKH